MILNGYHHQGVIDRPYWVTNKLHLAYWKLRVNKPTGTERRNIYRVIEKEKLRLAELGVNQELIRVTCRYLSSYNIVTGMKMIELMNEPAKQLCLNLAGSVDFDTL